MEVDKVIEGIAQFLGLVWNFIISVPFFDTGISFGQFMLSLFSAYMALSLLVFIFGGNNSGSAGSGGKH